MPALTHYIYLRSRYVATRDIRPGEQVLICYGLNYGHRDYETVCAEPEFYGASESSRADSGGGNSAYYMKRLRRKLFALWPDQVRRVLLAYICTVVLPLR